MTYPISRRSALMAGAALASSAAFGPLMGCAPGATTAHASSDADAAFATLSDRWIKASCAAQPYFSSYLGDHSHDGELDDVSATGRAARAAVRKEVSEALAAIDRSKLSRDNQVDAAMLSEAIEARAFADETLQDWAWDPLVHNDLAGGSLYILMARDFAPLRERLMSAASRMEKLPALLAQTRAALDPSRVPLIHASTYASRNPGAVSIIDDLIVAQAGVLGADDLARLTAAADAAKAAIAEHQTWIETQLAPNAKGDFRLGALYDAQLRLSISSPIPRAELGAKAKADAEAIRAEMFEIAAKLTGAKAGADPIATIKAGLAVAARDKPARERVMDDARKTLEDATTHVRQMDFITLPDAPVRIIEMPVFQQGLAVAYCDSPGPLDRKLDTFYAISPIPAAWTEAQTQSFLSEYNSHMLYELSIHEAMPGHYLQIWHSNKHPSVLRAVLSSGTFVEGWACYAEDLMIEQGFGADDPLRRLTNLKMRLRSVTNAILDQGVHVEGWDEAQTMQFLTGEAFQEEREAAQKWTRARISAGQLSTYYVGWGEHHALRRDIEAKEGASFNLKTYHDTALSHGSPPARFVRALMLGEAIA